MCQEVGHGFGLDHQGTSGADLNTCMDYSTALDNESERPRLRELETIYNSHVDSGGMPTFSPSSTKPLRVARTARTRRVAPFICAESASWRRTSYGTGLASGRPCSPPAEQVSAAAHLRSRLE
jgi:hypothetical protein